MRPFIGGIIVATGVFFIGDDAYIGLGIPMITAAFDTKIFFYAFLFKMIFTIVTLGSGYKGGEVTPLFFIGATLGNALCLFTPFQAGQMAGMGFVGVFAGATHTPIACTVMAIELFGIEGGIYFAIVCVMASIVSGRSTIYPAQMHKNSQYFLKGIFTKNK